MEILVTGGSGFIGGHVVQEFERKNLGSVYIMDIEPPRYYTNASFIKGSVLSPEKSLKDRTFDLIVHAAGVLGSHTTYGKIPLTYEVNIMGMVRLFEFIVTWEKLPRFIHTGLIRNWKNPYMITKHTASDTVTMYAVKHDIEAFSLGMTVVYGPRQGWTEGKVVPTFFLNALKNEPLEIFGDGLSTVNMMYVRDIAQLVVKLAQDNRVFTDRVYDMHLAYPHGDITVVDLAEKINAMTRNKSGYLHVDMRDGQPEHIDLAQYDLSVVKNYIPDYGRCFMDLDSGLIKAMRYYECVL